MSALVKRPTPPPSRRLPFLCLGAAPRHLPRTLRYGAGEERLNPPAPQSGGGGAMRIRIVTEGASGASGHTTFRA
jgi:hypothetical protein